MANKEFQVRHGLAVNNNVLVANTVTGNVSIGSNTASYKLDVAGTVRANRLRTWNSASNADWDAFEILSIGASSILKSYGDETGLILRSEAGNIILADDRGNVGIGTSNPQAALDVYNASRYALRLTGPVSNGPIFDLYRQNTRTAFIETDSSNNFLLAAVQQGPSLSLRTNGGAGPVDRLVITTDGNVGIGTSAPAYKLDVNGDARITGNLTLGDASTDNVTFNASNFNFANNVNFDSGTLYIDAANNRVGVGTTTPATPLHILGTTTFSPTSAESTTTGGNLVIRMAGTSTGGYNVMEIAGGNNNIWTTGSGIQFFTHGGRLIQLGSNFYVSSAISAATIGLFGAAPGAVANGVWITSGSKNYITSMRYADTYYPDLVVSAPNLYFNTKFGAAWADGNGGVAYGTTRVAITANGYVGIGTITPSANLHVIGDAIFTGNVTVSGNTSYMNTQTLLIGDNLITLNADIPSNTPGTEDAGIEVNRGSLGNASFIWDETSDKWDIRANNNNLVSIFSTGRVGIGTTSPASRLHVDSTLSLVNDDTARFQYDYGTAAIRLIGASASSQAIYFGTSADNKLGRFVFDNNNQAFIFISNASERMRIDASGNVGIGVTNTAGWKLRVHSNTSSSLLLQNDVGSGNRISFSDQVWGSEIEGINGNLKFKTAGAVDRMIIEYTGNIGVGTTPGDFGTIRNFEIANTSGSQIRVRGTNVDMHMQANDVAGVGILGNRSNHALMLKTNDAERMRINTNGNVGIGNTAPDALLHVAGTTILGGDTVGVMDVKFSRSLGGTRAINHWFTHSSNSPWYLFGQNMTWTGERTGTVDPTHSYRPYYEAYAPVVGYKEFGFANVSSGSIASSNLIANMVLTNTGNIGMGTLAPTEKLHVVGNILLPHSTANTGAIVGAGSSDNFTTNGVIMPHYGMKWASPNDSAGPTGFLSAYYGLRFFSAGAEAMRIDANTRNVGINSTSPGTKLEIKGIDSAISFDISGSGASALPCIGFNRNVLTGGIYNSSVSGWQFSARDSYFALEGYNGVNTFATASGSIFAITKANAFVGIGTTTPSQRLTVAGGQILVGPGDSGNSYINFFNTGYRVGAAAGLEIQTGGTDVVRFLRGSTETVRIDGSGNMGIGTTSPSAPLHVTGNASGKALRLVSSAGSGILTFDFNDQVINANVSTDFYLTSGYRNFYTAGGGGWGAAHLFRTTSARTYSIPGSSVDFIYTIDSFAPTANNGAYYHLSMQPIINQTGTANGNYTGIYLNVTETAAKGPSNRLIDLRTGGTSRFFVSNTGFTYAADNVAIGQTSAPERLTVFRDTDNSAEIGKAHVGFVGYASYAGFSHINMNGVGNYALLQGPSGETFLNSASGQAIYFRQNNTDRMILDYLGNLGIGTTGPNTLLHIYKGNTTAHQNFIKIEMPSWAGSAGYNKNIVWHDGGGDVAGIGAYFDGTSVNFNFHSMYNGGYKTTANSVMNIMGTGRVGIGTTSPIGDLQVKFAGYATNWVSTHIDRVGSPNEGTYKGYLILAKAFVSGTQTNSNVSGKFVLERGGTSSGNRYDVYEVVSKSAYNTETLFVKITSDYGGIFFSKTCKVTYGGVVYHAIETTVGGGGPDNGIWFDGNIINATPIYVDETSVSSVTSFGNFNYVDAGTGRIGIGTASPSARLHATTSAGTIAQFTGGSDTGVIFGSGGLVGFTDPAGTNGFIFNSGSNYAYAQTNGLERIRINSAGNIGIGISAPGKRVEISEDNSSTTLTTGLLISNINGTTDSRAGIVFKSYDNLGCSIWSRRTGGYAGDLCFGTKPNSSGSISEVGITERMRINGDGNIGIGTTTPYTKLHVLTSGTSGYTGGLNRGITITDSTGPRLIFENPTATTNQRVFVIKNDSGYLSIASLNDSGSAWVTDSAFNFTASGRLGITATSPSTKLQVGWKVADDATYTYDPDSLMVVHQTPTSTTTLNDPRTVMLLGRQGTGGQAYGAAAAFDLSRYENSGVLSRTRLDITLAHNNFIAQNTTVMTLLSGGNVGIGTTAPSAKLQISNAGSFTAIRATNTTDSVQFDAIAGSTAVAIGAATSHPLVFNTGNTERMRIDTNGNIGIGTTSITQDISGSERVLQVANTNAASLYLHSTNGNKWQISSITGGSLSFYNNAVQRMTIDSSGNVAIGQSSTTYKLQVNGSFAANTKSFVIDHPTKPGMKLRHGSLEGPENGVYVRGKTKEKVIELPEYWRGLVDSSTITVQLTAIGRSQNLYVVDVSDNRVYIDSENYTDVDCYYYIQAERKDVEKLVVEY